jgi:arylsulfatase
MPTLLEVAGVRYPAEHDGKALPPLIGKSWTKMLAGEVESPRSAEDYMAWEVFGNRALRQGDWKLRWQWRPFGKGDWELFDLAADPAERNDLAAQNPKKVAALVALWDEYVRTNNVVLPSRSPHEGAEEVMPERFPVETGYPPLIYKRQFVPPPEKVAPPKE